MLSARQIGPWTCVEQLGKGGNATVWKATTDGGNTHFALKVLDAKKQTSEPYRRFVQEVGVLRSLGDMEGILQIIGAHLPEPESHDRVWLAMPVATLIRDALNEASLDQVVEAVESVARTLAGLQKEHGLGHRDVKPGNLYQLDGEWLIGDFGLVDVPDGDLTDSDRPLGPAHYTAYEVIVDPKSAASGPADVYSLGKTLWVLATGQNWPPQGHQRADSTGFRISDLRSGPKLSELDGLVDRTTQIAPAARPTMAEVAEDLAAWRRLEVSPISVDLSVLRTQLRTKLAGDLEAYDLDEQRKDQARAAVRTLAQRSRSLNEELRALYPGTEVDLQLDEIAHNLLSAKHTYWRVTPLFEWIRTTKVSIGNQHRREFSLRMARSVLLLPDGMLHMRWLLLVGVDSIGGARFDTKSDDYPAPVGSVQQDEMINQFVADLSGRLPEAVQAFVEAFPDSS